MATPDQENEDELEFLPNASVVQLWSETDAQSNKRHNLQLHANLSDAAWNKGKPIWNCRVNSLRVGDSGGDFSFTDLIRAFFFDFVVRFIFLNVFCVTMLQWGAARRCLCGDCCDSGLNGANLLRTDQVRHGRFLGDLA